jgi:uncharacterized protein
MTEREVKFASGALAHVQADGTFEGHASLFGVVDLGRDLVLPGAFRACIARKGAQGIKLLWQHDPKVPLGIWEEISEDSRGLRVRGRLDLKVAKAREVHALMKSGAVDGLSICFCTELARRDAATGVRRLERLDLWEVSIVTFPMLPGARVSSVKAAVAASVKPSTPRPALADSIRAATARLRTTTPRPTLQDPPTLRHERTIR